MVVKQIKEPQVRGKFPLPGLPRLGLFAGEIRYPFLGFPDFGVSRAESINLAVAPNGRPNGRRLPANATFSANRPKISTFFRIPGFPEKRGFSGKSQKTTFLEIFLVGPTSARRYQANRIVRRLRLCALDRKAPGSNPVECLFFFPAKIGPSAWESGGRPLAILGQFSS